jgi:hypothetical protein
MTTTTMKTVLEDRCNAARMRIAELGGIELFDGDSARARTEASSRHAATAWPHAPKARQAPAAWPYAPMAWPHAPMASPRRRGA